MLYFNANEAMLCFTYRHLRKQACLGSDKLFVGENVMSQEKKVIFGQIGRLKKEKVQEYEALHANPWPEVLQTIHDCNLRNYSIFREGETVFAYFEYVGNDYEADMEKIDVHEQIMMNINTIVDILYTELKIDKYDLGK